MDGAGLVVASDLTLVEPDRVILRAERAGLMTAADAAERRSVLNAAAGHWIVLRLVGEIIQRARRPFPAEPIRTLDTLHLAALAHAQATVASVALLSLDERLRRNGAELGFRVFP